MDIDFAEMLLSAECLLSTFPYTKYHLFCCISAFHRKVSSTKPIHKHFFAYLLTTQHCTIDQCHWISELYGFPRTQIVV